MLHIVATVFGLIGLSKRGTGPPVLFASGLCNTMPSAGYSQFINHLETVFTVYRYDRWSPLTERSIERVVEEIDAPFDYIGHSSLLPSLFHIGAIRKFVLLDPAALPCAFDRNACRFVSQNVVANKPILVICAEYTSTGLLPFIPDGFDLKVEGGLYITSHTMGHADILNDPYASACHALGIRGHVSRNTLAERSEYRFKTARHIIDFISA